MAEILAGNGIHKAFKALGINAKRTYKSSHEPYYEVWELDKKDLKTLDETYEWPEECIEFRINDDGIVGFDYISPIEVTKTVVENSAVKSFDISAG